MVAALGITLQTGLLVGGRKTKYLTLKLLINLPGGPVGDRSREWFLPRFQSAYFLSSSQPTLIYGDICGSKVKVQRSPKTVNMPKTMPKDKVVFRSEVSPADKTPFMKAPHKVR